MRYVALLPGMSSRNLLYLYVVILRCYLTNVCPVIIADTEDNLQKAAHELNQLITKYGLTISVQKTKWIAFKGRDPVRTKIVIDNKIIEQNKVV